MTEPETEAETLDRLEAALARIASHLAPRNAAPKPPPDAKIVEALDAIIAQLRAVIQPPRQEG